MKQRHIYIIIGLCLLLCCPLHSWSKVTLSYQYWIDNNIAGKVEGTTDAGEGLNLQIDVGDLSPGVHFYNVMAKFGIRDWGTVYRTLFLVPETSAASAAAELQQYQYWLDNDYANRTTTECTGSEQTPVLALDVSSLTVGVHFLNVRTMDANGQWGTVSRTLFTIPAVAGGSTAGELLQYEYWIDDDYEHRVTTDCEGSEVTPSLVLDVSALTVGSHYLNVRAKDANGQWGTVSRSSFSIIPSSDVTETAELQQYEYWIDNDYENRVATTCSGSEVTPSLALDVSNLKPGVHYYNVRAQDADGVWGTVSRNLFSVPEPVPEAADKSITGYHYVFQAEGYDFSTVSKAITPPTDEYVMNQNITVALPESAPAVDDNCQFTFNTLFSEATMTRTVNMSFWMAFDAADGGMSVPVSYKNIDYSTEDVMEWTEMTIGDDSEPLMPQDEEPFNVVQFTIDEAMAYIITSDVSCNVRLYSPNGTLVDKADGETLLNGWRCELAVGTYYAVAFGNDEEAVLHIEEYQIPVITFADPYVEDICLTYWDKDHNLELDVEEAALVTDIGTKFQQNTNITSFNELVYFTSLTAIDVGAFTQCTSLRSITLPASVATIGENAFRQCTSLETVTLSNGLTSIGVSAFYNCSSLTAIDIPASVTEIADDAFRNCSALATVTVDEANSVYDSRDNCNAIVVSATNTLLLGCKNTFIPQSVTALGKNSFDGCTGLTKIIIPSTVEAIGSYAFRSCGSLTTVTARNETPVTISSASTFSNRANATLYVPKASLEAYKAANRWKDFNPIIGYENGDANGDGNVTIADAVAVVNYILGNASAGFIFGAADVNNDGKITITDAVSIVNMSLDN